MDSPRIALPVPTSNNVDYNQRTLQQYADAIKASGGEPVEISLVLSPHEVAQLISTCQGVLLPGSPNDLNPQKYGEMPNPKTAAPDAARENVDELLIQDAHNLHKPMLCICAGVQAVNVWRNGSLFQHLPDEPNTINHAPGREVVEAHPAKIEPGSLLLDILERVDISAAKAGEVMVNSSHHQALKVVGDGLRVTARSPQDAVIEGVEGTNPDHFLLGVQWHPERLQDKFSRAIFDRFVQEAKQWKPRTVTESIG